MKKVLMICYEFPPIGSPGSIRYSAFAKYLPKFGWEPVVLTIRNPSRFYHKDFSIHISKKLRIYRAIELPSIYVWKVIAKLTKVSVTSFPCCGWIPHTVYQAYKIIKKERIDLIFSTCLPFSGAFIGCILKNLTKKPVVIDHRDPLLQMNFLERKFWDKCIKNADLNTIVTKSMRPFYKQGNFAFIPNGYTEPPEVPPTKFFPDNKFAIVYTGSIFPDWHPILKNFFLAIKEFIKTQKNLVLVFVGPNHNKLLMPIISQIKLDLKSLDFQALGFKPYETCISLIKQASLNLILRPPFFNWALGTKIFDYLHSEVPVLGILEEENETAKFIKDGNLGIVVPNNSKAILKALNELTGKRQFQRNWDFLKRFDRREITKKLAELFDHIMKKHSD